MLQIIAGVVGGIGLPSPIAQSYGPINPANGTTGLIGLVSNIIKLIMLVGGIWAFFNLILAGITYVTSADNPDELKKANNRMVMSVIGLVIMVGSFVLAGIIGYLMFGDATFILNPKIYAP